MSVHDYSTKESCWAIVPVKARQLAKSRLTPLLDSNKRANLVLNLLEQTLTVLKTLEGQPTGLTGTLVVSADQFLLDWAEKQGAYTLSEASLNLPASLQTDQLNRVLHHATDWLTRQTRLAKLLVLPCDLPLLTPLDVTVLLDQAEPGTAVLAPDRLEEGTNAVALGGGAIQKFSFQFGKNSFRQHQQAILHQSLRLNVVKRPGLVFDLDQVADFEELPIILKEKLLRPPQYSRTEPPATR